VDYNDETIVQKLKAKKPRDLKAHEKFVLALKNEYGCRDSYLLCELKDYNADDFLVSSDRVISEEDSSY
jgi:hypothetical protein